MSRVQLALNVDDLDASIAFYTKLFQTPPAKVRDGYANFAIADPPLKLVLFANAGEPGTLNHIAVTRTINGSNQHTIEFFINGINVGTVTPGTTGAVGTNTQNLTIGRTYASGPTDQWFDGVLDEVRLWTVVRTQAQIAFETTSEHNARRNAQTIPSSISSSVVNQHTRRNRFCHNAASKELCYEIQLVPSDALSLAPGQLPREIPRRLG